MIIISIVGAIVPALWLIRYFTQADKFPEPEEVIKSTFWDGVRTVFWVLLVVSPTFFFDEAISTLPVVISAGYSAFLCAAIPEEFFKFRVLQKVSKNKAFDEPMDGIVYGAVASLGFATLENVLYCIDGGLSTVIARAFTAVPAHASFGAIMGYYFSKQHFSGSKVGVFSKAYFIPMVLHGLYDYFLFVMAGLGGQEGELADDETMLIMGCLIAFFVLGTWMYRTVRSMVSEMQTAQILLLEEGTANVD